MTEPEHTVEFVSGSIVEVDGVTYVPRRVAIFAAAYGLVGWLLVLGFVLGGWHV